MTQIFSWVAHHWGFGGVVVIVMGVRTPPLQYNYYPLPPNALSGCVGCNQLQPFTTDYNYNWLGGIR